MSEVCRLLGNHKTRTTPYNPKSDGLVERFNPTLLDVLAKLLSPQGSQRDWDQVLPFAVMAYRSAVQPIRSQLEKPQTCLCLVEIDRLIDQPLDWPEPSTDYAKWLTEQLQMAWERAGNSYKESASRQKRYYDRNTQEKRHSQGDLVWLHQVRLRKGTCPKLQNPWCGPWMVIDRLSDVTYRIQQGPSGRPKVVHIY